MPSLGRVAAIAGALMACAGHRPAPGSVASLRHVHAGGAHRVDEIVTLETRGHVRQPFLLATEAGAPPEVVALVFPGGRGVVGLPADVNKLTRGSMFFVRTRELFRDREAALAILDAPSDRPGGMDDEFRSGGEHLQDVTAVLEELRRRFPMARLFLVGTSRGTVSVVHLGRALGQAVDGVVLASTVFTAGYGGMGLRDFEFEAIAAPILFLHHAADLCPLCPYGRARELGEAYPLITVTGGDAARSDECGPLSAHGFHGKEAATIAAVKLWMLGRPYPRLVE
jgi:pimeloyl-ACP methyl ester carboxylesterase